MFELSMCDSKFFRLLFRILQFRIQQFLRFRLQSVTLSTRGSCCVCSYMRFPNCKNCTNHKNRPRTTSTCASHTTYGCGSMGFHAIPDVRVLEVCAVRVVPAVPVLEVGAVHSNSEPVPNPVWNRIELHMRLVWFWQFRSSSSGTCPGLV